MNLSTVLVVALGGALGSVARYAVAVAAMPISGSLPWGTMLINIAGSFLIGFVGTLTLAHGRYPLPETARLFVMVGFCGGFTTFSSFSLQTLDLLRAGATGRASPTSRSRSLSASRPWRSATCSARRRRLEVA